MSPMLAASDSASSASARQRPCCVSVIVRSTARPTLARALESIARAGLPATSRSSSSPRSGPDHPTVPARAGAHPVRLRGESPHACRGRTPRMPASTPRRGDWITFLDDDDTLLAGPCVGPRGGDAQRARGARRVHACARALRRRAHARRWGRPYALIAALRAQLHPSVDGALRAQAASSAAAASIRSSRSCRTGISSCRSRSTRISISSRGRRSTGTPTPATSGAGGGANQDDARFARFRDIDLREMGAGARGARRSRHHEARRRRRRARSSATSPAPKRWCARCSRTARTTRARSTCSRCCSARRGASPTPARRWSTAVGDTPG